MFTFNRKQVGCIVWNEGMNRRAWIDRATAEGYIVQQEENYATLWLPVKQ